MSAKATFRCPICRSHFYKEVVVAKAGGFYKTEFFECSGCSVMFRDPDRFTRFEPYSASVKGADERRRQDVKMAYFGGHKAK
jgi:hypothetical protein